MGIVQKSTIVDGQVSLYWDNEYYGESTIVYFPSGANTGECIKKLIPENFQNRVISLDFPGRGGSESLRDKSSIKNIAKLVHTFLLQQNFSNLILVGTSFGTAVIHELIESGVDIGIQKILLIAPGEFFSPIEKFLINVLFFPPKKSKKIRTIYKQIINSTFKLFNT